MQRGGEGAKSLSNVECQPTGGKEIELGCPPAGAEVPADGRIVARHAGERIVANGDIVTEVVEQALAAERIEYRVQESQGSAGILIQVGDDPGPTRRSLAG